jgi:HTH-type transcriptional regulator/antitoxin MqsA
MSLTIEACPICGEGPLREVVRDRHLTMNGGRVIVHGDVITQCDCCHDLFYTGVQAKNADRKANDARRRAEGLLTSREVKDIRQGLAISQSQLEAALGVGPKTVVRWENGASVQGKAVDDVLRLIALDPDNLRLLVSIRDATLATNINRRLRNRDLEKVAELRTAVLAALERYDLVSEELTVQVSNAIVRAIRAFKREKMQKLASRATEVVNA